MKSFLEKINSGFFVFDGGMGTMLQSYDVCKDLSSESCNLNHKDIVSEVHLAYLKAGSDMVSTNTFGLSKQLADHPDYFYKEVAFNAVSAAKSATDLFDEKYVVFDIGPTGTLMAPYGDMTFDRAYDIFKLQAIEAAYLGADAIIIETMTDLAEARIALLACKENSSLPVIVSMSFQQDGRTLSGTTPDTFYHVCYALGANAIGINCSLGPNEIFPLAKIIAECSEIPILIQANAGMPVLRDGMTVFPSNPADYSNDMKKLIEIGITGFGGCCGTSPDHIVFLKDKISTFGEPKEREILKGPVCCSGTDTVYLKNNVTIIGERLNPSGNKPLREALKRSEYDVLYKQAILQEEAGAQILDLNCGIAGLNEIELYQKVLPNLINLIKTPIQFDSSNPNVFEGLLRTYPGKAIINSANGKMESMHTIFPVAKKYGAMVICLLLDDEGLPESFEKRMDIAESMVNCAKSYGLAEEDLIFDCLTLTAAHQQDQIGFTLNAIESIKNKYTSLTALGVSNISFGLPNRAVLNKAFLGAALERGLDLPIMDPFDLNMMDMVYGFRVIKSYDERCSGYIEKYANQTNESVNPANMASTEVTLISSITNGYIDTSIKLATDLLLTMPPLELINEHIVVALKHVGEKFETGKMFLPQLIRASEAAGAVFEVIRNKFPENNANLTNKVILATVKGDIHDIGKNLVKVLLKNHGFNVIDLGKDVAPQSVLDAAIEHDCKLIGLSALMTTTLPSMEETITLLKEKLSKVTIMVGGAVLTESYAKDIHADQYCYDALATVHFCQTYYQA